MELYHPAKRMINFVTIPKGRNEINHVQAKNMSYESL